MFLIIVKLKQCVSIQPKPFLIRYVPDQYKAQQMCGKAILENGETLMPVLYCYKNQQMCDKAADTYPHALYILSECYKTHNMCNKAADTHTSTIQFVPECYKTQE